MLKKTSILVFTALIFASSFGSAEVDTRVKWGGEYRLRTNVADNLDASSSEKQDDYFHRLILKGSMAPNDAIMVHFSLNLNQPLGSEAKRGFGGLESSDEGSSNDLQVLTAYGDWHLGSSFFLNFGRLDLNWGNEVLVSRNYDDQRPYSFDGLVFGYDSETFLFNAGTLRVGDLDRTQGPASTIDPDESAYFVSLDFKSFGRLLKTAEFFLLRIQSSNFSDVPNGISIDGSSLNRIGFSLGGEKGAFSYQADYVNLLGSYNSGQSAKAFMVHMNLGYNFGDKSPGRVYVVAHTDSGDDSGTSDVDEGYRPVYYNHHKYAGLMDILAWGNLTYYGLGFDLQYKGHTDFKVQALRFSLTDESLGPNSISYLGYGGGTDFISEAVSTNSNGENVSALGTELDVMIKRNFTSKAYIELILGAFITDDYFEAYGRKNPIYSLRLSTGFSF